MPCLVAVVAGVDMPTAPTGFIIRRSRSQVHFVRWRAPQATSSNRRQF